MENKKLVLLFIIFLAFLVRLYRFDNPVADWHSWRQADTSAVSRNFVKDGFDLLHPRFDDLSNVASGRENPEGYRLVEFPLYNLFQAGTFVLFDFFTLEGWGRLVTIFSSLGSVVFLYLLVKKHIGELEAQFAAFFYAFLPFSIYYGRVILPDTMMVAATLGGIYFFDRAIDTLEARNSKLEVRKMNWKLDPSTWLRTRIGNWKFLALSVIFTVSALLLKPHALFFMLPMVYLAWKKFGFGFLLKWQLWVFAILSILPLVLWRMWVQNFPEGIPDYKWLFNSDGIRFRPAFFRWIAYERLTKLILGYSGMILFSLGLIAIILNIKPSSRALRQSKKWTDPFFLLSFLVSSAVYVCVIATGNVRHDYYQISILPTLCILLACGAGFLLRFETLHKNLRISVVLLMILASLFFSWRYVRDYFNVNNWAIVKAGKVADTVLPKDAKVIAPYNGDTAFLYQTNRRGWPVFTHSIEELIQKGAEYLVIAAPTQSDFEGFGTRYTRIAESKDYLILRLR